MLLASLLLSSFQDMLFVALRVESGIAHKLCKGYFYSFLCVKRHRCSMCLHLRLVFYCFVSETGSYYMDLAALELTL